MKDHPWEGLLGYWPHSWQGSHVLSSPYEAGSVAATFFWRRPHVAARARWRALLVSMQLVHSEGLQGILQCGREAAAGTVKQALFITLMHNQHTPNVPFN